MYDLFTTFTIKFVGRTIIDLGSYINLKVRNLKLKQYPIKMLNDITFLVNMVYLYHVASDAYTTNHTARLNVNCCITSLLNRVFIYIYNTFRR